MAMVIKLTADQANQVRGPSDVSLLVGLQPVALTDGSYYLPTTVLDAPLYDETDRDFIAALPMADFSSVQSLLPTGP